MDVREKLVGLVKRAIIDWEHGDASEWIADHLIANGVTVQKWISVNDRLPEAGKFVLIYNEINGVCMDYHDGVTFGYYDVTHWMPMPHPPKGE